MARGYRSRRYRPSRRVGRRFKKSSSMRKVKKDILKCNFPTKVKFMGLSEKKVMFLTESATINDISTGYSTYLVPGRCPNISSIAKVETAGDNLTVKYSNWDKMCILGIYIKFQPIKNQWMGSAYTPTTTTNPTTGATNTTWTETVDTISEVKCTYTFNNVPDARMVEYDNANIHNKQVFTFNSNEAFTIYIPAPPTMSTDSACVHKSKTWWSITDMKVNGLAGQRGESEEYEDEEMEDEFIGTPYGNENAPMIHAGRLFLKSNGVAKYNITINYKVALKG